MLLNSFAAVLIGYLLGSFPSAQIAARIVKRKNIREIGGGNMGALNTIRGVGFIPGALVFIADAGKGALAVMVARWLKVSETVILISAFASVLGHIWSVYLRFKGGRGAATGYGIFLALAPQAALVALGVIISMYVLTSNAWLALGTGFVIQVFMIWAFGGSLLLIGFSVVVPMFIGIRSVWVNPHVVSDFKAKNNLIVDHDYTFWGAKRRK
jgi:acyl phosphate:glycerol-3-phosphate acyltransferase